MRSVAADALLSPILTIYALLIRQYLISLHTLYCGVVINHKDNGSATWKRRKNPIYCYYFWFLLSIYHNHYYKVIFIYPFFIFIDTVIFIFSLISYVIFALHASLKVIVYALSIGFNRLKSIRDQRQWLAVSPWQPRCDFPTMHTSPIQPTSATAACCRLPPLV